MARDEEDVQRALGTLGKYEVTLISTNSQSFNRSVIVEALNELDAIVKAKIHFMMEGMPKTYLDSAEWDVNGYKEDDDEF